MKQERPSQLDESQPPSVDRRLIALEERLAFAEQTVDTLNEVVQQQQAQIDRLVGETGRLESHLERLSERAGGDDLPHEKPPHY